MPDKSFKYPCTSKGQKNPQNVFLGIQHISGEKNCFKYSPALKGLLCIPCVLFTSESSENDRRKSTKLGCLVNSPLARYDHLLGRDGYLTNHLLRDYHVTAQERADNFVISVSTGTNIIQQIDTQRCQHVKEQRERLEPIIKTTILCGRMGIGYRGRRDDGPLGVNAPLAKCDGNFKF